MVPPGFARFETRVKIMVALQALAGIDDTYGHARFELIEHGNADAFAHSLASLSAKTRRIIDEQRPWVKRKISLFFKGICSDLTEEYAMVPRLLPSASMVFLARPRG
jgi:hypothetical protein